MIAHFDFLLFLRVIGLAIGAIVIGILTAMVVIGWLDRRDRQQKIRAVEQHMRTIEQERQTPYDQATLHLLGASQQEHDARLLQNHIPTAADAIAEGLAVAQALQGRFDQYELVWNGDHTRVLLREYNGDPPHCTVTQISLTPAALLWLSQRSAKLVAPEPRQFP